MLATKLIGLTGVDGLGDEEYSSSFDKTRAKAWASAKSVRHVAEIEAFLVQGNLQEWGAAVRNALQTEDGGVIREDLVEDLVAFTLETALQTPILDLYRGYISDFHYQLLATALAAHNLRELGKDNQAIRLIAAAEKAHGHDARKINNLYSAGYLQSIFACELQMFKAFSYENDRRLFRSWFEDRLRFFEDALFVNFLTGPDEVVEGLTSRACGPKSKNARVVSVWAAGREKVLVAQDALKRWIKQHPEFDYAAYPKSYGSAVGAQFVVFHKASHPEMKASRLDALLFISERKNGT
jgi:hypothetical protein